LSNFSVLNKNETMNIDGGYTRYRDRTDAISPEQANREGRAMLAGFAAAGLAILSGGTSALAVIGSAYLGGGSFYLLDK